MKRGIVSTVTRRHVNVVDHQHSVHQCRTASRALEPCVGDEVEFEATGDGSSVRSITDRANLLKRSYGRKTKLLAANIDLVFLVTAPAPLFNTSFIDRVLVACFEQNLEVVLVINKCDLVDALKDTEAQIKPYEGLVHEIVYSSAKQGDGISRLSALLEDEETSLALLTGVSGVGKSTILNQLIPDAAVRTSNVSGKTGQGRQTTSQSVAHLFAKSPKQKFIIDLPGVQNFGLTHLSKEQIKDGFEDFSLASANCQFANCSHLNEPDCAVINAVDNGTIAAWRLDNYRELIKEKELFPDY